VAYSSRSRRPGVARAPRGQAARSPVIGRGAGTAGVGAGARGVDPRIGEVNTGARGVDLRTGEVNTGARGVDLRTGEVNTGTRGIDPRTGQVGTDARGAGTGGGVVGREGVVELQRARILAAMSELVCERGVAGVTIAHVVARSGVSRRTFYELFEDREGCLLAAFDHSVERVRAAVLPVYREARRDGGEGWEGQIRAALAALLAFLDEEPALGRLLVVDALAAEHRVLERRTRILDAVVDVVHRDARAGAVARRRGEVPARSEAPVRGVVPARGEAPARIVAEGVVGAVLAVIHARLLEPSARPLSGLLNPLMGIVVLPYLGPDAAARELTRPRPRPRRRAVTPADPLRGLDMRLTYRTVRVLIAIAELGGQGLHPSGRQVADASDISDQGQMSKLLARLQNLGLIHNNATARGRGGPNAWALTTRGREVEQAIRAQAGS
jgi:AcrR family transcriptional regulator